MTGVEEVAEKLREEYGIPEDQDRPEPLLSLVQVILSQNTNDTNRDRAYTALMEKYSSPREIMEADTEELAETISVAGLHNLKAERIQDSLGMIEEEGELSLDFLEDMRLEEAKDWLTSLPGVGPKSAAVVLNFTFDKAAFPVDTHVFRVSKRLGLIPEDATRESAHDMLEGKTPDDSIYEFHINLIKHGREVCKAPVPRCSECSMKDICDYYEEDRGPKR
ncbi:MAG: endonuclease III [Candidatus Nanohaloarchaeota archaeon QJJ-7]|nr:endonuclease III [Candidatus Nanohaloarchaeota archaeon QJJ-7]